MKRRKPRLSLPRQCLLAGVIDKAQRNRGAHTAIGPDGWRFRAEHNDDRTRFTVKNDLGSLILEGECS